MGARSTREENEIWLLWKIFRLLLLIRPETGTLKWEPSKFRYGNAEVWRTTNVEGCRLELHVANGGLFAGSIQWTAGAS